MPGDHDLRGGKAFFSAFGTQDQTQADAMVRYALDAGVNFFDTSDIYNAGEAETVLGQALRNLDIPRDQVVIGSKAFGLVDGPDRNARRSPNDSGLSRRYILQAIERSLTRLGTDYLDLYQAHGFDPVTPLEETLRTFDDLIREGKVRYIGCSNWPAWAVMEALGVSAQKNLHRMESVQLYYSLAGRDVERELVPMMLRHGLSMIIWSALCGGFLAGKYTQSDSSAGESESGRRAVFDFPPLDRTRGDRVVNAMRPIAESRGVSVAQIAIAWLLQQPVVASVIVGVRRMDQLEDNLAAVDVRLSEEELAILDEASALPLEYPGWMRQFQDARHLSWRKDLPPDASVPGAKKSG